VASEFDQNVLKMFQEVWSSSICQVLKEIFDEDFNARVTDSIPVSGNEESAKVWIRFSASGRLSGEIDVCVSQHDAVLLSGPLRGAAPQQVGEPSGDLGEPVAEVWRRIAGAASTAFKSRLGGEVEFVFCGFGCPSWEPCFGFRLEVAGPKTPLLQVLLISNQDLAKSAAACLSTSAVSPSTSEPEKVIPNLAQAFPGKENIGLLLDIELEAALRFGEREMLLREILNLNSGSVIELNRRVNEPVELLVCGKVVAKGDVVVLDGNYALRVTQIGSAADRMSSLRIS
jgi:flagellar motor switch protein FliN/FliY